MDATLGAMVAWQRSARSFALAVVVAGEGSTPLPVGSWMGISSSGEICGSVSGGCVEGDVIEVAGQVLRDGHARRRRYGIPDDVAIEVGLMCGGAIEVLVERFDPSDVYLSQLVEAMDARRPVALVLPLPAGTGRVSDSRPFIVRDADGMPVRPASVDQDLTEEAIARQVASGRSAIVSRPGSSGPDRRAAGALFVRVLAPPPRMLVFGVSTFAIATASLGRSLGYHVTVCDARSALLTRERFPEPHELVAERPHRYLARTDVDKHTVICVLTHDEKFDLPLLRAALASQAAYVGAIGSRRTDVTRRRRLQEQGVTAEQLARLRSPIGLDLGGRAPEEVALSICAEIVMLREARGGRPLSATSGPLHRGSQVLGA